MQTINNNNTNLNNNKGEMEMANLEGKIGMVIAEEEMIQNEEVEVAKYVGVPKFESTKFEKQIAKPAKYSTEFVIKHIVENNDSKEVLLAVELMGKFRLFNKYGIEVYSKRLSKTEFSLYYNPIQLYDIADEHDKECFENLYNNIETLQFPNGYPHRESALVIGFESFVYLKDLDMLAIVTHTDGEPVGKGYMEVTMNESLLTIFNQQRRKVDKTYYGTMITFKANTRKCKTYTSEQMETLFNGAIDNGFLHIKNGKLQLDENNNPIIYRDCLATGSQTRQGYLDCCMNDEFDIIHNQMAFMGLPFDGQVTNVAKLKARGGNAKSNGIGIGTRDIFGNLHTPDVFDYMIIDDVEEEEELNVLNPIEISVDENGNPILDENGDCIRFDEETHKYAKMVGCEEKTIKQEVNKNDGFSLATMQVMALMSLRMRLINQLEYDYFTTKMTIASFLTFNRKHGTEFVVNKVIEVAKKHNIDFNISMLGEEVYSALLDCERVKGQVLVKALKNNCKELFEACVNDLYHFTNINMSYINKRAKLAKIWKKVSPANIVRYQQTFVKGLLVAWDIESKTDFDKEIVLTKSMVKVDVANQFPNHKIDSNLPWLVCKVATAKDYSEYNTQFWMQLDLESNDLVDLAKNYIGKLERSFSEVSQALETLGAIGTTSELNKIGELLNIAPELLGAGFIQRKIASLLKYKLAKITKGKIPVKGGFRFIITDPRILTGKAGLRSGENYLDGMTQEAVISRNPALSKNENHKISLVNNSRTKDLEHLHNILVLNQHDCVWLFLGGADFDGDIAFVCWDELVLKRFRKTEHGVNIITRGNRKLAFNDESRKMLLKENLGGGQVGLYTDQLMNFVDYAYNNGWTYDDILPVIGMGVNYVGKEIDCAKTGEQVELTDDYTNLVIYGGKEPNKDGKLYQIKKADWMWFIGKEKKSQLGDDYFKDNKGKDAKFKILESKHALGHLVRYMMSKYKVHTCPVEANKYFEENCMLINDQPILDKLYMAFNKDEVENTRVAFVQELEKNFRYDFAHLMSVKKTLGDDEQFNQMVEELELKHALLFEQACELNNINPMLASVAAYIAPQHVDLKKGVAHKENVSNTSCAYVFHCAYEHFYNACKLAFDGIGMFRLPVRTLEEELEVVDGKITINSNTFNVKNIEDGVYEVATLASDNQYLVYTKNNNDISDKVARYNEIKENTQAITISTRIYKKRTFDCSINGKGKATPLSTFLNIQLNDEGEFVIRKDDKDNYIVMVGDTQVGIVVRKEGMDINPAWANCKFKLPFADSLFDANGELSAKGFATTFGAKATGKVSQRLYTDEYLTNLTEGLFEEEEVIEAFKGRNGISEYFTLQCNVIETLDEEIIEGLSYTASFDFVKKSNEYGVDINGFMDNDLDSIGMSTISDMDIDNIQEDIEDLFINDEHFNDMDMNNDYDFGMDIQDNIDVDPYDDEENFYC